MIMASEDISQEAGGERGITWQAMAGIPMLAGQEGGGSSFHERANTDVFYTTITTSFSYVSMRSDIVHGGYKSRCECLG
jgi:hypothetical protein